MLARRSTTSFEFRMRLHHGAELRPNRYVKLTLAYDAMRTPTPSFTGFPGTNPSGPPHRLNIESPSRKPEVQTESHLKRFGGMVNVCEFWRGGWRDSGNIGVGDIVSAAVQQVQEFG